MTQLRASSRRSPRSAIVSPANCELPWGRIEPVVLADISAGGCRITTHGAPLSQGARVLIRTAALFGASGTVHWDEEHRAGIEFDAPLAASILQHLEDNHAGGTTLIIPNPSKEFLAADVQ